MAFRLNSCLCFSLRTGTLVTLYLELVICILSLLSSVELIVRSRHSSFEIILVDSIFQSLVLELVPFVVGLYGAHKRKPSFLMVVILDVFVLTGFFFHDAIQMGIQYHFHWITMIQSVTEMLIFWYFGLVWYSYFLELKKEIKSTQSGNVVALNSA